jgi:hypothetical protein
LEKQRVLVVAAPFAFLRRVMGAGVVLVLEDGFSMGARASTESTQNLCL